MTGLDKVPTILVDTMLPNVNPETAAKKSVIINGGYDPCHYNVSFFCLSINLISLRLPDHQYLNRNKTAVQQAQLPPQQQLQPQHPLIFHIAKLSMGWLMMAMS